MQDYFFPLNLVLKYVGSSEIHVQSVEPDDAKPDHYEPDHAEPNQGLRRQIVMCRQKREQSMSKVN
jgi:hypothetical protein